MGGVDWRPFIYGGVASCVAEFATFPIDTTKTRLQIQGQHNSLHSELRYRGMTHALVQITKQEGFKALYAGIAPAALRQTIYGTIKFGTYYSLKRMVLENNLVVEEDIFTNMVCAVTAAMVSSAIANPTDVLKVRMQVRGHHHSLLGCFQDVYYHEGLSGLWRGVGPTAQRAAVIAVVELPVYDFCKLHLKSSVGDNAYNHSISSFIASLLAAVASTPIDVVRTRLMNQRKYKRGGTSPVQNTSHLYKGSVDCLIQTVRNEGVRALFKGLIPTWVRMVPWNIIFFNTLEQLNRLY